jgi:hypothetical protein
VAFPTILFNSGGSDTLSSGAGPATALNGNNAATASNNLVTLAVDAPDLSGVDTTGLAVICVQSSSGRRFSKITAVNNSTKVVTTEDNYANIESGKSWAIGGKLASIGATNARKLFQTPDAKSGWTLQLESNDSISVGIDWAFVGDTTNGPVTLRGATEGIQITQTANSYHFQSVAANQPTLVNVQNLKLICTNATRNAAQAFNLGSGQFTFETCIFGDLTNTLLNAIARISGLPTITMIDCEVKYCTDVGLQFNGCYAIINGCWVHNCTSHGVQGNGDVLMMFDNTALTSNGGDGYHQNTDAAALL